MSFQLRSEAEAKFPLTTELGRDNKAWAKRLVHRHQRGDKTLLHCQITFAYAALEIALADPPSK